MRGSKHQTIFKHILHYSHVRPENQNINDSLYLDVKFIALLIPFKSEKNKLHNNEST